MEGTFTPIDRTTWPRNQVFHYFSTMAPTGYSVTVELDVTEFRQALKERGLKFFPAYLWLTTTIVNRHQEYTTAYRGEELGSWDCLTPLYATFHEESKSFSLMWTEYDRSFHRFYQQYLENQQQFGDNLGILAQPDRLPPENSYIISALPWVEFKHFSLHSFENKPYFFPSIEAGKFVEQDGRYRMPLSITAHHATTDGWHVKCLVEELQAAMDAPEQWIA